MSATVVVGTQWGDEGKGKVVDFLADEAQVVVRFNGGANAGHTVLVGDEIHRFHLIPSGILRRDVLNLVGNGVVVDPSVLLKEIGELRSRGYPVDNLRVSERAHVVLPFHKVQDELEEGLKGGLRAGTTKRGIGPCYEDKAARVGVRVADLLDPQALAERLAVLVPLKGRLLRAYGGEEAPAPEVLERDLRAWGKELEPYAADTSVLLHDALAEGREVLFEGAQGTHLDIDHGIYPFGTSSNCVAAAASIGTGVGFRHIDRVVGVTKAFTSRVGTGPFPAELTGEEAAYLRDKSLGEYGTTTGRPRRIGWLDAVMVRYAARVNGLTHLAVTKLDVLAGVDPVRVCVAYEHDGQEIRDFPASTRVLADCRPVYEEMPGWKDIGEENWVEAVKRGYDELPGAMRAYLDLLTEETGVPVGLLSVGPGRAATLDRRGD